MGHDFRPDYLRLKGLVEKLSHPPVCRFERRRPLRMSRQDIITQLGSQAARSPFVAGFDRPNLRFHVKKVEGEKV